MAGFRIVTLFAFVGIALVAFLAAIARGQSGSLAAMIVPETAASNTRFMVTHAPTGDALRRGDRIEIVDPATLATQQFYAFRVGTRVSVRRLSPSPESTIAEAVTGRSVRGLGFFVFAIQAMFVLIAALIAARGRSGGSLQLAWFFASIVLLFNPVTWWWPPWAIVAYSIGGGAIAAAALLCAADFASRFVGDPQASWARRYRAVARAIAIFAIVTTTAVSAHVVVAATTPIPFQSLVVGSLVAQAACFLVGLAMAWVRVPPLERQRVVWVVGSLGVGIVGFVASISLNAMGVPEPLRDIPLISLVAMPLGCAYAILRYRLLDVAFVVNRATVFGVTSLLVLAALALVDYGLQTLLGSWLRESGLVVQLGLALAIGIWTRPLHGRVDALVDDLFFRHRHEAERILRHFARDVAFIDDVDTIATRTVATIARAARLECSLFLAREERYLCVASSTGSLDVSSFDRNDGVVVRLLATREPVDLREVESVSQGDFAFPMFVRSRLVGLVLCGGKTDGAATYAPDEIRTIAAVADAVGLALDFLRVETLEREIAELRLGNARERLAT